MIDRPSLLDLAPAPSDPRPAPREILARVVRVEGARVWVSIAGGQPFPLPAQGGGYIVDAAAWVAVDEARRPVAVMRPARDAAPGDTVQVALPELAPEAAVADLSDEDRARLEATEAALDEAAVAIQENEAAQAELQARLAAAFVNMNGTDYLDISRLTTFGGPMLQAVIGELWAQVITADRVRANMGVFNDLVARHVNVTSAQGGRGMRLTDQGLVLTGPDGTAVVDLTTASRMVMSIIDAGRRLAGFESDGGMSAQYGNIVRALRVAGRDVLADLDAKPAGQLGPTLELGTRTEVRPNMYRGLLQTSFTVPRSGHRQIRIQGAVDLGGAPESWAVVGFHFSTNQFTTPSNDRRRQMAMNIYPDRRGGGEFSYTFSTAALGVQPGQTVRVLMSVQTGAQGVWVENGTGTYLIAEDIGRAQPVVRVTTEPLAPVERPISRQPVEDTVLVPCTAWQTYNSSGGAIIKGGSDIGARQIVQGAYAGGSLRWGLAQFDRAQAEVAGATIKKIEVIAPVTWTHYYDGSIVVAGVYGPIPASMPRGSWGASGLASSARTRRGGEAIITLPSATWAGWQNGTTRSVSFALDNTDLLYYAQIDPAGCYLRITRER